MNTLLVFTEAYSRGGGNRYAVDLINSMLGDYENVVFASNPGGIFEEDISRLSRPVQIQGVAFITRSGIAQRLSLVPPHFRRLALLALIPLEPILLFLNVLLFLRLIRKIEPNLVISCNGGYPASQSCQAIVIASWLMRAPVLMSIVSMPSSRRPILWLYDWLVDTLVWQACRRVLVNAHTIQDALMLTRGLPAMLCSVVHNGIENIQIQPRKVQEEILVIGCVARLDAMKGVFVLLDAFTELAATRKDVRLVLAGEGDASDLIADLVHQRSLSDIVSLLGHYSGNVDELLSSFDVFAFPSLWEGFPYSILEAMRSECAIVATRVGGIPEAIDNEKEGLLVEAGDKDGLVAALTRVLGDLTLRRSLAAQARHRFVQEFSLDAMYQHARLTILEAHAYV